MFRKLRLAGKIPVIKSEKRRDRLDTDCPERQNHLKNHFDFWKVTKSKGGKIT